MTPKSHDDGAFYNFLFYVLHIHTFFSASLDCKIIETSAMVEWGRQCGPACNNSDPTTGIDLYNDPGTTYCLTDACEEPRALQDLLSRSESRVCLGVALAALAAATATVGTSLFMPAASVLGLSAVGKENMAIVKQNYPPTTHFNKASA